MKRLRIKLCSVVLIVSMVLGMSVPALAAERSKGNSSSVSQEEIDAVRKVYSSLSPEAKKIFDESLMDDPELLDFHITYVDKDFKTIVHTKNVRMTTSSTVTDALKILMDQLNSMGLPTTVLYALKATGAGMVAAVADGPLPIGDILFAAAAASAVVIIAANWSNVIPKWTEITNAFKKAFANSAQNVTKAFALLRKDVDAEIKIQYNKSAEDAVGNCDLNKQHHIMDQSKHNWNKLFPKGPDWNKVSPILVKVLQEGQERSEGGGIYKKILVYKGETVVVRFVKDVQGFVKFVSTAWVE